MLDGRDLLLNISRLSDPHLALAAGWQRVAGGGGGGGGWEFTAPNFGLAAPVTAHCMPSIFIFFDKHKSETNSSNLYYQIEFAFHLPRSTMKRDRNDLEELHKKKGTSCRCHQTALFCHTSVYSYTLWTFLKSRGIS